MASLILSQFGPSKSSKHRLQWEAKMSFAAPTAKAATRSASFVSSTQKSFGCDVIDSSLESLAKTRSSGGV